MKNQKQMDLIQESECNKMQIRVVIPGMLLRNKIEMVTKLKLITINCNYILTTFYSLVMNNSTSLAWSSNTRIIYKRSGAEWTTGPENPTVLTTGDE